MPSGLLAGLLVLHGVITTAIGLPAALDGRKAWTDPGLTIGSWFGWWPTTLGRSWMLDATQVGPTGYALGGVVWSIAGLALLGAGLGLFGVPGLERAWQPLAVAGGGVSLVALALYLHPIYAVAVAVNLAILATQAGTRGPLTIAGA